MAWIESHSNLARHPKTRRLMKLLGWSLPDTIGNLHLLWWWALDFAPTGDLSRFSAEDLTADLDLCGATPEQFVAAMVAAGFLDRIEHTLCIHDWTDYNRPKLIRKSTGSSRPAEARAESSPRPAHLPASSSRPAQTGQSVHPVVPPRRDHSEPPSNPSPTHAPPGQHSRSASAEHRPDLVVPPGRETPIPHLLAAQPGFTNVWPKFLEMYKDMGCPLTSYERRELFKRLHEKPRSAVSMLETSVKIYRSNHPSSRDLVPSRPAPAGTGDNTS